MKRCRRTPFLAVFLGTALAFAAGCGADRRANVPTRSLPTYAGKAAGLFDDNVEPAAVGLDFDKGYAPRTDPVLRERAQTSDAVLRVRVSTVTAKKDGPSLSYELELHTMEKIAGANPPPTDFRVRIEKTSESLGMMKNFESRLVGYSFVAFVREFLRADGDREVHFHLAPDTKDVKLAVGEALVLGEVK